MTESTWIPAPRRGIIPAHPLPFGTILGKSFAVLRHNPAVLFGFAVVIQFAVTLVVYAGVFGVMILALTRLENLPGDSFDEESQAVLAGSMAVMIGTSLLLGLISLVFNVIVQGVVTANTRAAMLGRKARLSELWQQVRPVFWRLLGFTLLMMLAFLVFGAVVVGLFFLLAFLFSGVQGGSGSGAGVAIMVLLTIMLCLAGIPLLVWLSTNLARVPSVLVIERVTVAQAITRSWRLTKGRFWVSFGVLALIGLIIGMASNVISAPASLLSIMIPGVLMPTGGSSDDVAGAITVVVLSVLLPQVLILLISAIGSVVQATASTLLYLDSRMRYEGLDHALLVHAERAQTGAADPGYDPFTVHPRPAPPVYYAPPAQQSTPPVPPYTGGV